MAAGGLKFIESANDFKDKHFMIRTISLAKQMIEFTKKYTYRPGKHLKAKIGIHYGSCIFGVLGYHKPQFSLIGDTINTTSRVCTTGNSGNIILSRESYSKVQEIETGSKKGLKKKPTKDKDLKVGEKLEFIKQVVYMKGKGDVKVFIVDDNPGGARTKQKKRSINKSIIPHTVTPQNPGSMNLIPSSNNRLPKGLGLRLDVRSSSMNEINPASSFISPIKLPAGQMAKVFQRRTSIEVQEEEQKPSPQENKDLDSPVESMVNDDSPEAAQATPSHTVLMRKGTVQVDSKSGEIMLLRPQKSGFSMYLQEEEPNTPMLRPFIKQNTKSRPVTATIIPQTPDINGQFGEGLQESLTFKPVQRQDMHRDRLLADTVIHLQPTGNEGPGGKGSINKSNSNESVPFSLSSPMGRLSYAGSESPRHRMTMANIKPINFDDDKSPGEQSAPKGIVLKIPSSKRLDRDGDEEDKEDSSASSPEEGSSPRVNKHIKFEFEQDQHIDKQVAKHPLENMQDKSESPPPRQEPGPRGRVVSYGGLKKQITKRNAEGTLIHGVNSPFSASPDAGLNRSGLPRGDEVLFPQNTLRPPSLESEEEQNSDGSGQPSDDEDDVEDLVGEENRYIGTQDNSESLLLQNEYRRKNIVRHSGVADVCLGLNILDIVIYELISFMDSRELSGSSLYRISHYLIAMALVVLIIMQVSKGNQRIYKGLIYLLFGIRMVIDLMELHLNNAGNSGLSIDQIIRMKWIVRRSMAETIFFMACGLYYPVETLVVNVIYLLIILINLLILFPASNSIPEIVEIAFFLAFNYFDTVGSHKYQYQSFCKVMAASKMSIQYVKFVNRLLPKHIQQSSSLMSRSETYKDVTILFADIVGFTAYSAGKAGRQVVEMLSRLFTEFDKECNRMNLFKLYTIGDCYVVMGFLDKHNRKNPAEEANDVVQLGISMISIIQKVRKMIKFEQLNMRIGIHTVRSLS